MSSHQALVKNSTQKVNLILLDGNMGGGERDGLPTLLRLRALYAERQARSWFGTSPGGLCRIRESPSNIDCWACMLHNNPHSYATSALRPSLRSRRHLW